MEEKFVVDRIEGGVAVLEAEDRSIRKVRLSELPEETDEGSCLILNDGSWSLDKDSEETRRNRIRSKMERLFKH